MAEFGVYVWSAVGLTSLVLVVKIILSNYKEKKVFKELRSWFAKYE